jgi:hypothetical protein
MTKGRSNETSTPQVANELPELSLEELTEVRGGRCRGRNRDCGAGNRPR